MNWQTGSKWHLESACKRYTVGKVFVNDAPRYVAWRLREQRAPLGVWTLTLNRQTFSAAGSFSLPNETHKLAFKSGELRGIEITPTTQGAVVSGELVWPVAGDEAGDVEPLLGGLARR